MKSLVKPKSLRFVHGPSLALALVLGFGCSGELEGKDDFESQVTAGLGAKGVSRPLGSGATPVTPAPPPASVTPTPVPPPTPSGGLSAQCADVQTRIFQARCAGAPCHGEPGMPTTTYSDFVTPTNLAAAVKDVPAKSNCTSMKLVDSANPANSALLKVITATPQPCTSTPMPVGQPLSADEIACVTEWVNAVASGAI